VSRVVWELLAVQRTVEETADLLDARLITCTVLSDEHRRLGTGDGWGRYEQAGSRSSVASTAIPQIQTDPLPDGPWARPGQ